MSRRTESYIEYYVLTISTARAAKISRSTFDHDSRRTFGEDIDESRRADIYIRPFLPGDTGLLLKSKLSRDLPGDDVSGLELLEELNYIPLVISQAVGFILENYKFITISDYVKILCGDAGSGDLEGMLEDTLPDSRRIRTRKTESQELG